MHASVASSLQEARLLEHTHVLADSLEGHVEWLRQLSHSLLRPRDPPQDRPPRRMRQGPKNAVEVLLSTVNHTVDYQHATPTVNQLVEYENAGGDEATTF